MELVIENYELFIVPPRWVFLRIETEDGIIGWGEPVIEGRALTVASVVNELMENYVIGRSANEIEDIFQVLYRGGFYRGGPILTSAISGIETALWDIKAKSLNVPIYNLMGGKVRDKVEVYCWIGGEMNNTTPEQVADQAEEKLKLGYHAIKMNATANTNWIGNNEDIDGVVNRIKAIKNRVGNQLQIGLDFHGRVHKALVKPLIHKLNEFDLMFIEEPILSENMEIYPILQQHAKMPIAIGERMYTRWDFKRLFELRGADIIQPDICHAGGIWETRKIAAMAEAYDLTVALHCPLGPIAFAASLQLDFCTPNACIQETSLGIHYNDKGDLMDYLIDPNVFEFEKGYVKLLKKPGLGIEINEELVKEKAIEGHNWKNLIWRNNDGSFAEW